MSLATNISNLATRIATECKSLRANNGDLTTLTTSAKSNLVAAINELQAGLQAASAGAAGINDSASSGTSTYSSSKIDSQIAAAVAALVNGAPAALDTLAEIATQLANDEAGAAAMSTAIGNRVRFDAAQTLTTAQKAQALSNIAAAALVHTHAISDVTGLQSALDGKSAVGHTHSISDVANLQSSLDGKQASSALLTALAGLTTAADQLIYATAANTFSTAALTSFGRSVIACTNVAAIFTLLGLGTAATKATGDFAAAVHTHAISDVTNLTTTLAGKQASSALLTAIAGITSAADQLVYNTGTNTVSTTTLTSFARSLLDDADAATMRSTLALGTAATYAASAFAAAAHVHAISDITGLSDALAAKANASDVGDTTTNFVTVFNAGLSS